MSYPIALTSLTPREAIADAFYRCTIGLDINDKELFESAWIKGPDATFDMDGSVTKGTDALSNLLAFIGPLDTTHLITNVRVDVKEGADTAYMTCAALAQHYRAGEGTDPNAKRLMSGSRSIIDLVKDSNDGLWPMKKWTIKMVWTEGDMSIVTP